jgi:hypothetical protein
MYTGRLFYESLLEGFFERAGASRSGSKTLIPFHERASERGEAEAVPGTVCSK